MHRLCTAQLLTYLFVAASLQAADPARTIYVNRNAPAASLNDGSSWANAYRELREALPAANNSPAKPVEIWVATGTYTPTTGTDRSASFGLGSHVRILGGFAGTETKADARSIADNPTVLSGDIGLPQASPLDHTRPNFRRTPTPRDDAGFQDNTYNIITCFNCEDVVLEGLIIANGNASDTDTNLTELLIQSMSTAKISDPADASGGQDNSLTIAPLDRRVAGAGLLAINSAVPSGDTVTVTINNCVFANNAALGYGAAVAGLDAAFRVGFSKFQNNVAGTDGGALWCLNGFADFLASEFDSNVSVLGSGGAVAYQTIVTADRLFPWLNEDEFREQFGLSRDEIVKSARLQGAVMKRFIGVSGVGYIKDFLVAVGTRLEAAFERAMGEAPAPKPAASAAAKASLKSRIATGVWKFYVAVDTLVTLGDIGFAMAEAAGEKGVVLDGWKWFSYRFNTYATPAGWSGLIVNEIVKAAGAGPTFDEITWYNRRWQNNLYNQGPYSTIRLCRFSGNFAGESGGAIECAHDNLSIDGSLFEENRAAEAGAIRFGDFTTPKVVSSVFQRNRAVGHSAIANIFHARSQIANCTIVDNVSDDPAGYAVGNEMGAEARISNCILWNNINNATNATSSVGADIFTATVSTLGTNELAEFQAAGPGYGDWVAICDISHSCIQSLTNIPTGSDNIILFPEHRHYSLQEVETILKNLPIADENGEFEAYSLINIGQGNRPNLLDPARGNIDDDPQLLDGYFPSASSPVINRGSTKRITSRSVWTITGVDITRAPRFVGASVDIGAVEFAGAVPLTRLYVRQGATGTGSGLSWANAMTDLQTALRVTNAEVWVAAGTYFPTAGNDRAATFSISNNVAAYGGFAGVEQSIDQRDWTRNVTTLSGNIGNPASDSDNSFSVVSSYGGVSSVLDGFVITKGRGESGAGLNAISSSLAVRNCAFVDNRARQDGGAINGNGSGDGPLLANCRFAGNAASRGGALNYTPRLRAENCIFENNSADSGGAVALYNADQASFYNCLFTSNAIAGASSSFGGAIDVYHTPAQIYNCTFQGNHANLNLGFIRGGGAIDFRGAGLPLVVENSIFWHNSAPNAPVATIEKQQISVTGGGATIRYTLVEGLSEFALPDSFNIADNPVFVDEERGNFRLRSYSPFIDAGNDSRGDGYPGLELDGNPRFVNLGIDLGAYEYQLTPEPLETRVLVRATCDGTGPVYRLSLSGLTAALPDYRWDVNRNDSNGFVPLVNDSIHAGATNAELVITHPPVSMNGYSYRLRVPASGNFTSTPAILPVSGRLYVRANATGANNGADWVNAFTTLTAALNRTGPCSEIWVAQGTYYATSGSDRDAALQLRSNTGIYGGFAGTETALNQRDWQRNVTVLSGDIGIPDDDFDNSRFLLRNDGSVPGGEIDASAVLDGFTLKDAAEGSVLNQAASPTLRNCVFIDSGNESLRNSSGSRPTVTNCYAARVPFAVCDADAGATFAVTAINATNRAFKWQVNSGTAFTVLESSADYAGLFSLSETIDSSTLSLLSVPSRLAGHQYRFAITGTAYNSPSFQLRSRGGSVVYVKGSATGNNTGTGWANAFTNLQDAISSALGCVEIWVAQGTYVTVPARGASFTLKTGVALYGGFNGAETDRGQRNWKTNPTILRGLTNHTVVANNGESAPIDSTAAMDGFIIAAADGTEAILNLNAHPSIRNCIFSNNLAVVIHNERSQAAIINCVFSNNFNRVIWNRDSSPLISACVFGRNNSSLQGGAIYNETSTTRVEDCLFAGNSATDGAAIFNWLGSDLLIRRCIFDANRVTSGGGAVNNNFGSRLTAENSLFTRNTSLFRGGAISHFGTGLTLVNCTFSENSAVYSGGGLVNQGQATRIQNSVFWQNRLADGAGRTVELAQIDDLARTVALTNSIVEGLTTLGGTNNLALDPLFLDPFAGNYRLSSFSPGINAGSSSNISTTLPDLAGVSRLFGTAVDMGAYEFQSSPQGPLVLLSSPARQSVCEGAPTQFSVVWSAGTNYDVTWLVNITPVATNDPLYKLITTSNSSTLIISNVTAAMNGSLVDFKIGSYFSPDVPLEVSVPTVLYVNAAAGGANNGSSWANAFRRVQDALSVASQCSEIWVAGGTYTLTNDAAEGVALQMRSGVGLYGGFAGNEASQSQRNWITHPTRLVGGPNRAVVENDGYLVPVDNTAVLDGFSLSSSVDGMDNSAASPVVRNCIFENAGGSAVWNFSNAKPLFFDCTFRNNTNGAIYSINSAPTISGCLFSNNISVRFGAAIENNGGDPVIVDCRFIGNVSTQWGGAIVSFGGAPVISRCIFDSNQAQQGGAIHFSSANGTVANSLFIRNSSSALHGGAVSVEFSQITMRNCTLTGNNARGYGGGIYQRSSGLAVANNILWKNVDRNGADGIERAQLYRDSGSLSISYSDIQGLNLYAGNSNLLFEPLFIDPSGGDYQLRGNSPLIDAGNNALAGLDTIDLKKEARFSDGVVDLGAFEVQFSAAQRLQLLAAPDAVTMCVGDTTNLTIVTVSEPGANILWEVDAGDGNGFRTISLDGHHLIVAAGNSSTLVLSNVVSSMNANRYRYRAAGVLFELTLTVKMPMILYVDAAATGNNSGSSWVNAFTNLDSALSAAEACSEIWVARGTYTPALSFQLKTGVKLLGGFAGNETSVAQRNAAANVTTLLGSSGGPVIYNPGLFTPIDRSAVLDGFTVTAQNGNFGLLNQEASPTIRGCRFEANPNVAFINASISSPLIEACAFVQNQETAIFNSSGATPLITNCTFTANHARNSAGAIFSRDSAPVIARCVFDGNSARFDGGAIEADRSQLVIFNCIFRNNSAAEGGALEANDSAVSLINSLFHDNSSAQRGAAIASIRSDLRAINCTIAENRAGTQAGGIYQYGGTNDFHNGILWRNTDHASFGTVLTAQSLLESGTGGLSTFSNSCLQGLVNLIGANFHVDPLFSNPATKDFHLDSDSPLIDKANSNDVLNVLVDLDGQPRFRRFGVDIGAYEAPIGAVDPLLLLQSPASLSACENDTALFTVVLASNYSSVTFNWEYNDGSSWNFFSPGSGDTTGPAMGTYNISSTSTSSTLRVSNIAPGMDGYQFRILLAGGIGYRTPAALLGVVPPGVIYVNASASAGGDGSSWARAFTDLQAALSAVSGCRRQIWVAAGVYFPSIGIPVTFKVSPETQLFGGFAGNETALNQRNWHDHPTILNGDIGVAGDASDNAAAVILFDDSLAALGTNTVVDGFVVQQGLTGIAAVRASPSIRNCVLRQNRQGMNLTSSTGLVYNCSFVDNHSLNVAGGLNLASGSSPTIQNCLFSANTANGGAAIGTVDSYPTFINCLITGNAAPGFGGGIDASRGAVLLINTTIAGNLAGGGGGGLFSSSAQITVRNSIFWNNGSASSPTVEQAQLERIGGGGVDITNSCLQGLATYTGNANTGQDPLFVSPLSSGTAPVLGGDYHLQQCSLLINSGSNPPAGVVVDLDGLPRISGTIDVGPYESQTPPAPVLAVTTQPASITFCGSALNRFAVAANGNALSFRWQIDRNDGIGFVPLADSAIYSGTTTAELAVTNAGVDLSLARYRCLITSAEGCSVASVAATLTVLPQRWFVNSAAPAGGDGRSWNSAFNDLSAALDNPNLGNCGSEIWVTGFFLVGSNVNFAAELKAGVALYGGFTGSENDLAQRDWIAHPTILQGWAGGTIFYNSGIPLGVPKPIDTARLDGFVLENATRAVANLDNANPLIVNCLFRNNTTAIENSASSPRISNCVFIDNNVGIDLLGLGNQTTGGTTTIDGSRFQGQASYAIRSIGPRVIAFVRNCLFSGNGDYALLFIDAAGLSINNATVTGNKGGVFAYGTPVTIYNSILWSNVVNGSYEENSQIYADTGFPIVGHSSVQNLFTSRYFSQGSIAVNPIFRQPIDPATAPTLAGDFHLSGCSPLINIAHGSFVIGAADLDGNDRTFGAATDLGAYELSEIALAITASPTDQSASYGSSVQFVVTANRLDVTYQWQVDRGTGFSNLVSDVNHSGVNKRVLTLPNPTLAMNNYRYRCVVVTGDGCARTSASAAYIRLNAMLAVADSVGTDQNTTVHNIAVLGNDVGQNITFVGFGTNGTRGLVTPNGNGTFEYDPNGPPGGPARRIPKKAFAYLRAGQSATDTFTYTIMDLNGETATGTVTVNVSGLNDVPIPFNAVVPRFPGPNPVKIDFNRIVASSYDYDRDPLFLTTYSQPTNNGGVFFGGGGAYHQYNPGSDFAPDGYTYTIVDFQGGTAVGRIYIPVEDLPNDQTLRIHYEVGDIVFAFRGVPFTNYQIEYSTSLQNPTWILVGYPVETPTGIFYLRDNTPIDSTRFYRVVAP